jgi:tRNA/rRNA methyltransferase
MFEHLREALTAIGYLFSEKGDSLMAGVRHLLGRAQPSPQEVKLLHGLARQMLWAAGQMRKEPPSEPGA